MSRPEREPADPAGYVRLRVYTTSHSQMESCYRAVTKLEDTGLHFLVKLFTSALTGAPCRTILVRSEDAPRAKVVLGY